jgi:hypothetical protein
MFIGGVNPESGRAFKGFDIIRIHPDDSWETVVGPDSLSGYDSGFNHFTNAYNWWMEEHDGWLYASSLDNSTLLADGLRNLDTVIEFFQDAQGALKRRPKPLDRALHAGADIFKTCDGVNWAPVTLGGLGDPANYGFRTMESVGDTLFLGTANPFDGLEIWAAQSKPSQ